MDDFEVVEWTLDGVLDEIKRIHESMKDRQFAFIIGAGASFSSGIPTGHNLATKWLKDLHLRECTDGRSLEKWISELELGAGALTLENAAEYYPKIFERRFGGDREAGYAELEAAMEGKQPSLGYSLLAEIIQTTRHKVVVTTNFDNLVADALAMHAHQSPLIVAHESLAGFVRPQMRRPLVAKIHRDLYLNPLNDTDGVSIMKQSWITALKKLFQHYTPVVVGYGGNDGSLMDMLMGLDRDDIAGRMIWCYRETSRPPEKALGVLKKHQGLLVKITGFDEFMLQLASKLVTDFDVAAIAERTIKLGQERAERYRDQASKLGEDSAKGSPAEQRAGTILTDSVRMSSNWWAWHLRAKAEPDPIKKANIYKEGIDKFPDIAELKGNYAILLKTQLGDPENAEKYYKEALLLAPDNAFIMCSYASFLAAYRKNYDTAEELYKKSIEQNPSDYAPTANYANFLADHRNDIVHSEKLYKKAIELNPSVAAPYAGYANLLTDYKGDHDTAEIMYQKAMDIDPSNVWILNCYANFVSDIREDYDHADNLYKKSIELDPRNATATGNYAVFLSDQRGNRDQAEWFYKKALDLDPDNERNKSNYDDFLRQKDIAT